MSEGKPWIDEIMRPLQGISSSLYNPIYEAVSRGTPEQGQLLVGTIITYKNVYVTNELAAAKRRTP